MNDTLAASFHQRSDSHATMNEESKPSILLSLPPELWHQIMKAVRRCEGLNGVTTWREDQQRRRILRNAASAHRILQPYAQEELLRILSVGSEKQLIALVEALEGSSRLAKYAKRTEFIELYSMMDEGEGLNELLMTLFEMCCNTKTLSFEHMVMRLSTIAVLNSLHCLATESSTIHIDEPTAPFARLTQLDFDNAILVDENGNECDLDLARSLFSPVQFPALRQISINRSTVEEHLPRFSLLLPQLSHVKLSHIPLSLVAIQLVNCTSLKKLRLHVWGDDPHTDLLPFFNSLRDLNLEEFHYYDQRVIDREASLRDISSIMARVGEIKTLKKLSLQMACIKDQDDEIGKKWRVFKEKIRKMCQKNKVEMVSFSGNPNGRRELTWVD